MAYHRQQGVDTAIVRIFNTYGPRMRPNDGRAIPNFLRQALAAKPLTVFGDGSQTRSFCYVDDLIRGLVLLAESGEHCPVNLGNPGEMTLLELAEAVLRVTGLVEPGRLRGAARRRPAGSASRTSPARKQLLGWEPEIELDDGLRRTTRPRCERTRPLRRRGSRGRRGRPRRGARRAGRGRSRIGVALHPLGDLRRRDGPLREPGDDLPAAQVGEHRDGARQSVVGRAARSPSPTASRPTAPTRPIRPTAGTRTTASCCGPASPTMRVLFSIIGTPNWANGGKGWNVAPTRPADLQALRHRRGRALQRHVRPRGRDAAAEGAVLARLERAQQPHLPQAAVRAARRQLGDAEPEGLRARSATRSSGGSSRCRSPARSAAARRRRAATTSRARLRVLDLAAALPARDEALGRDGLRRLRAPPVLRHRRARRRARRRRRRSAAHRRQRSRSATSRSWSAS